MNGIYHRHKNGNTEKAAVSTGISDEIKAEIFDVLNKLPAAIELAILEVLTEFVSAQLAKRGKQR